MTCRHPFGMIQGQENHGQHDSERWSSATLSLHPVCPFKMAHFSAEIACRPFCGAFAHMLASKSWLIAVIASAFAHFCFPSDLSSPLELSTSRPRFFRYPPLITPTGSVLICSPPLVGALVALDPSAVDT